MRTKQTIAVIGDSGNLQAGLITALSKGNYRLLICSGQLSHQGDLLSEIQKSNALADVERIECAVNASWEADIIISSVPIEAERKMAESIQEVVCQKILISLGDSIDSNTNMNCLRAIRGAQELQVILPNSKVVKLINPSEDFEFIEGRRKHTEAFIAGKDQEAVHTVSELLSGAGFSSIMRGLLRPKSLTIFYIS